MQVRMDRWIMGPVGTNVYALHREDAAEAVVIDPADQGREIFQMLSNSGLTVAGILLTHGHFDHIDGVAELKDLSGCRVYASEAERQLLLEPTLNGSAAMGRTPVSVRADVELKDREIVKLAGIEFLALATPGHTAGGMCYYIDAAKALFSGDTLFQDSVGRTDLPTGSMSVLVRSVREQLLSLDDAVVVYPGHGAETTIGNERRYNPFL